VSEKPKRQVVYVDIKRSEKKEVEWRMKKAGYRKVADNHFFMRFDKTVAGMTYSTCCEYDD